MPELTLEDVMQLSIDACTGLPPAAAPLPGSRDRAREAVRNLRRNLL